MADFQYSYVVCSCKHVTLGEVICSIKDNEAKALTHWVENAEQAWALEYFVSEGMSDQTAEKLVLKYPKRFESEICEKAKDRIKRAKL